MRHNIALVALFTLTACATEGADNIRVSEGSVDPATVTYYDRNDDGVADLELHEPRHCDDCDWALVDTNFDGRYDKRVRWSFGLIKEAVDLPVPDKVALTVGRPAFSGWED